MQARDGVFLEDLCPKLRARRWRQSLHLVTDHHCLYCGDRSESIDHVQPLSRGGQSITENCVPACLGCNGSKGDSDAFSWYRGQSFYDPRRAMALRAWIDGDMRLAERLLLWTRPESPASVPSPAVAVAAQLQSQRAHQTRQAATPLWRWQMAS
ncbi:MAG: HNH endonuclease [Cyanobium sp.]